MEKLKLISISIGLGALLSFTLWVAIDKNPQSTKDLVFAAYELGWIKGTKAVIYRVDNTNEWNNSISQIEFKKDSLFLVNALYKLK